MIIQLCCKFMNFLSGFFANIRMVSQSTGYSSVMKIQLFSDIFTFSDIFCTCTFSYFYDYSFISFSLLS